MATSRSIIWRDWSKDSFQAAKESEKLILLDLTASWCHWCHVMDETTYSDPDIILRIQENFIPVRVDIDMRPDISERYNRGGFPTTAFLSCKGESIWGTTYIPPEDMHRIMDSILAAKKNGEIERALAKVRIPHLDIPSKGKKSVGDEIKDNLDSLFEEILIAYDHEHGGFGDEPKFPHPDVIELMASRYTRENSQGLAAIMRHTLFGISEGLYDEIDGGLFRYSVTRDWKIPHYEKMLDTNSGFLKNLIHAHIVLGDERLLEIAQGVADYMISVLQDGDSGGFFGSQDAHETYYRSGKADRRKLIPPSIDRTVYAGWNADASHALIDAGSRIGRDDWIAAGIKAFQFSMRELLDPGSDLVRHTRSQELYLFEDQVSHLSSVRANLELSGKKDLVDHANRVIGSIDRAYEHAEGGRADIIVGDDVIGDLRRANRSLISNSKYAYELAMFSGLSGDERLLQEARDVLGTFDLRQVAAHGIFSASYLTAMDVVRNDLVRVDLHLDPEVEAQHSVLWKAARSVFDPRIVIMPHDQTHGQEEYAVICGGNNCSDKIVERAALMTVLSEALSSQV
ncbi:MAG: DUF255 domain-containing protein [Candidatus Thermoplasmatota archaeon]|nr:DUF255 domain-containing protein [Candidatus Thermoplasmatota archaeon]